MIITNKIESYNSSYPAAYYEVGKIYSFYGSKSLIAAKVASQEYVRRYSSVLKELETKQRSKAIQPVMSNKSNTLGSKNGVTRYYAVVVAKSATAIEIMFLNEDDGRELYLTKKYTVSNSCTTDGKDLMAPMTKTNISGVQKGSAKIGGITKAQGDGNSKVGGITKVRNDSRGNVGGITRVKNDNQGKVGGITRAKNDNQGKVGGITRAENDNQGKVGGITRAKQDNTRKVGGITKLKN